MGTRDPRVDAYIAKSAPFARPILAHLRKVVHAGCPEVEEAIKWGVPHFTYKGMLCGIAAFREHCAFGFWKGSLLDLGAAGSREAMGHFGRITSIDALPPEKTLIRLVKEAAALNDAGVKVAKRAAPKARPEAAVPPDLAAALKANRKAAAAFAAFPPGHRREYVEWITEAKRDETRAKRVATAVEWVADGKGRNWKYERRTS